MQIQIRWNSRDIFAKRPYTVPRRLTARFANKDFEIGIPSQKGEFADDEQVWLNQGLGVVEVRCHGEAIAVFAVEDTLREEARPTIDLLGQIGIEVMLLTGDRLATAQDVANRAGITKVVAQATPERKQEVIQHEMKAGKIVAMAGDGINDTTALASADVSVAMGGGSDIAIETAQLTLAGGNLSALPKAVLLARATLRVIRENLFWAFIYNVIGIPLAAGVLYSAGILLNPMFASAAMALSSICVVLNSLRLNKIKLK